MPKSGFKSITIKESIYDSMKSDYDKNKNELEMKGIFSFAGYMTYVYSKNNENQS